MVNGKTSSEENLLQIFKYCFSLINMSQCRCITCAFIVCCAAIDCGKCRVFGAYAKKQLNDKFTVNLENFYIIEVKVNGTILLRRPRFLAQTESPEII